jgi:hypothetical protein
MSMELISSSPEAVVQQDLTSPAVGEDFCLRRGLNKSREKYDLYFLTKRRRLDKEGPEVMLEGKTCLGCGPMKGAPPILFWPHGVILRVTVFISVKN